MEQKRTYSSAAEIDELYDKVRRAYLNGADTESFTSDDGVEMLLCNDPDLQRMWHDLNLDCMVKTLKEEQRAKDARLRCLSGSALSSVLPRKWRAR